MTKKTTAFYVVIVGSLASFMAAYTSNAVTMALPELARVFHLSNILQNWTINLYLLTMAVLSVPFGKYCAQKGLKKSFFYGALIFFLGTIGIILSINTEMLLFFRFIQAIGSAAIFVSSVSMIVKAVPNNQRGKALGINISSVYIGLSLAPVLGGTLTYNFGWESIFAITLPMSFIVIILTYLKIKEEWQVNNNDPIDIIGIIFYTIGISAFMYGFTELHTITGQIITGIGVIFLITFIYYELKQKYPIFDVKLYKNHKFLSSNIASVISYISIFSLSTIINYHFQYILGWNAQMTGLILISMPLMQAIVTPQSGKLSDLINPQKLSALGMGLATIAILILTTLNDSTSIYTIIIALMIGGIGYGLFSSPNTNTMMSSVPSNETTMASAAVATMRVIGQTLSIGILTVIFAFVMGNVNITPSVYPQLNESCHIALICSTILGAISVLASLVGMNSNDKLNTQQR
ncbi:MFS transporter [uncultured Methanobrevibacter sp.]|uniref:MFS transporter n=1 Tax=uncultured Methanobrevibacter sp. TaxID=253161 RepID=UPI00343622BA